MKTVIEMARIAGARDDGNRFEFELPDLKFLVALVRADERARLAEQPVQKRPQNCGTNYCSCIECVMEPAPVQEPVGYFSVNDYGRWEENENEHGQPFYTSPPAQRKPLTDEQIDAEFDAFASKFDHESNEWLDMGVDAYFRAGFKAAHGITGEKK